MPLYRYNNFKDQSHRFLSQCRCKDKEKSSIFQILSDICLVTSSFFVNLQPKKLRNNNMTSLKDLIKQGEAFAEEPQMARDDKLHVNYKFRQNLFEWQNTAFMFLYYQFPNHPQSSAFKKLIDEDNHSAIYTIYQTQMGILNSFLNIQPSSNNDVYSNLILSNIFNNFNRFVHQLKRKRHNGRNCFISDEYDVQDLLYAVLKLHFDDVIDEECLSQNAGSKNRMDFLIKDIQTAIEVKYAKDSHKDKQIGDELIIDIDKYSRHPNCKSLYCFIYDPNHCIVNPRTLEKDLNNKSTNDFKVKVFVRPLE